jgi:N-acetylglutamate synthase-like GNAT family acetyltransferase
LSTAGIRSALRPVNGPYQPFKMRLEEPYGPLIGQVKRRIVRGMILASVMTDSIRYILNGPFRPEEIQSLIHSAGLSKIQPLSRLVGMITGSDAYVTAQTGDKFIGFGRLLTDYHSIAYINYMVVDPAYQQRGIGQAILKKLVEASGDVERVFLYTDTADAFYMQNGFTPSEKRLYLYRKKRLSNMDPPDPS